MAVCVFSALETRGGHKGQIATAVTVQGDITVLSFCNMRSIF